MAGGAAAVDGVEMVVEVDGMEWCRPGVEMEWKSYGGGWIRRYGGRRYGAGEREGPAVEGAGNGRVVTPARE